jgi:putative phosphoribosyl transferase
MNKTNPIKETSVKIPVGRVFLEGELKIPFHAKGMVVFAHGSGSSRHSPRNQFVARILNQGGLATLLLDLLTMDEEALDFTSGEKRFDIPLLAKRLEEVTNWLLQFDETKELKVCYFGASTGAAAALAAAAEKGKVVKAIVSRGGRPDLALNVLSIVQAPTLLIVGGNDFEVIRLNQRAFEEIKATKKLEIIPHATHLFEEPGALEEVGRLAFQWFQDHLPS